MIEPTSLEKARRERVVAAEQAAAAAEAQLERAIPKPVGYKLLIALPDVKETFGDTSIVKSDTTVKHDTILSMVGLVLDMGSQAYMDPDRYPTGPWCKQGDYVMFRANTGTRFKVGGKEFRLMNDDSIEAVVPVPDAIQRVN